MYTVGCACVCMCVCVCLERERERERAHLNAEVSERVDIKHHVYLLIVT